MAQRRTTTHDERRWAGGAGADGACCDAFALRACNARVSVGCSRKLLRGTTELACMSVCSQYVPCTRVGPSLKCCTNVTNVKITLPGSTS